MSAPATYPDPFTRTMLTIASTAAVMMVTIDATIAIIALPSIQSNLAASHEQIAWVLTSYLIAGAIATPLSGWLADRFGRNRVIAVSVASFTLASLGCGLSPNLEVLVLFRFLQGATGASVVPLTQVLLLDINPPERHGPAIALFGMGSLFGPMIGPTLGGWLTEYVSWRAIFLINAPIGAISLGGFLLFGHERAREAVRRFDARGFAAVAIALTAMQLMIDRGQTLDWFSSREIAIEATVAGAFAYIAVVHMFTTRDPFIKPAIFRDRNFLLGTVMTALLGVLLNGVIPMVANMMQQLLGYPVILTGMLSAPRAIGNMLTILVVGRIVSRVDARLLIFTGMLMLIWSLHILTTLSLDAGEEDLALVGFLQGCGSGLLFLPLNLIVFNTLPPALRNEGSTLFALTRNLGGAVGISMIQAATVRATSVVQSHLVETVRPDNPVADWRLPDLDWTDPASLGGLMGEIARQATMVAYVDSFRTLLLLAVAVAPLCLMLRMGRQRGAQQVAPPIHAE
ncbi:MAG: DHA2 family efflux MFS transporter permease subunit [Sphingomonadales bacterium]|nr:DHA2 family efflux MFS transporter permease subunit [Sphingomonadales bacterium]